MRKKGRWALEGSSPRSAGSRASAPRVSPRPTRGPRLQVIAEVIDQREERLGESRIVEDVGEMAIAAINLELVAKQIDAGHPRHGVRMNSSPRPIADDITADDITADDITADDTVGDDSAGRSVLDPHLQLRTRLGG